MTVHKNEDPPLGDTGTAKAWRIGASLAGAVPFAGATIHAILTEIIPNVRAERMETYIRYLQEQVDEVRLELSLKKAERLDLFEEGLWQSARAFTNERRIYIAKLVAEGITTASEKVQKSRHFLRLLNQLGDEDIAILVSQSHGELSKFQEGMTLAHQRFLASFGLLVVTQTDLGGIGISREEGAMDAYAITEIGREFLDSLGIRE